MCGRFYITIPLAAIAKRFGVGSTVSYTPSFNVAPGQYVTVVINEKPWKLDSEKWGLVPSWSKLPSTPYSTINARVETLEEKPMFRSLVGSKRCVVPASGFFEWKKTSKGKIPYRVESKYGLVGFAGLWDEWVSKATGQSLRTFTIITVPSNEKMKPIHDRMPVMLLPEQAGGWLDKGDKALFKAISSEDTVLTPISSRVNSPKNNDEDVLAPLRTLV